MASAATTSLKRAADDDAAVPDASPDSPQHSAAPAPTHLFVVLADMEYDAGLCSEHEGPRPLGVARTLSGASEILKTYHDAEEAKRTLKDGEERAEFKGLDEAKKAGKVVAEAQAGDLYARVEKWKVATAKTIATGAEYDAADAAATASTTTVHYAYTIVQSWSDYYGDYGGHTFHAVVLQPSAVPGLACAKLPCKGLTRLTIPPADVGKHKDGAVVAQGQDSSGKGNKYMGTAKRWLVRDWEEAERKKAPPKKKAKTA
ncbi:hypothetical protein B0H10DRAFT_1399838 [Mycena sp. CBHHK59/15]|nr:hypothetical protein B0H10DRAFT_1399838 [Mycena sp. CBHHK59/15]